MTHPTRSLLVLAGGFVLIGVTVTILGVTWPSVAEAFDRSLAELGYVTLLYGTGYTLSTLLSGSFVRRARIGSLLILAAAVAALALGTLAVSDMWQGFLIAAGVLGAGTGLIDAATNTYIAIRRGAREMGFVHAAVGIGAVAGPLLFAALVQVGVSWRLAFAILAIGQAVYALSLWLFARDLDVRSTSDDEDHTAGLTQSSAFLWSLIVFFVYIGIAAGASVWAYTFFTEERGMNEALSGIVVAASWGGLTVSRLLLGSAGERFSANTILRWSGAATTAAFIVFWWSPTNWLGALAFVFAGFAHGPVFPLEVVLTPHRFGTAATASVVGYQIAAANVGSAVLPGLMGIAVASAGLDVIPPLLAANAIVLWAAIEMLRRHSRTSSTERSHSAT